MKPKTLLEPISMSKFDESFEGLEDAYDVSPRAHESCSRGMVFINLL
jgi:hypothetical protein